LRPLLTQSAVALNVREELRCHDDGWLSGGSKHARTGYGITAVIEAATRFLDPFFPGRQRYALQIRKLRNEPLRI
jgi:hypothetical protein